MKICSSCKIKKPIMLFSKHSSSKDGLKSSCKECLKEAARIYRIENKDRIRESIKKARSLDPDRFREYNARYREKNKEKIKQYDKKYRLENRDKEILRKKRYRAENREKIACRISLAKKEDPERFKKYSEDYRARNLAKAREASKNWARKAYLENPEKYRQISKEWRERNPEQVRIMDYKRRHRELSAEGSHSAADIRAIHKSQKYRCVYCKVSTKEEYHIDHIQPLSKGGSNWPSNIQILCPTCNMRKSAKDPVDFAQERGMLL